MFTRRNLVRMGLLGLGCAAWGAFGCRSSKHDGAPDGMAQRTFLCFDTVCTIGGVMPQELLDAAVDRCQSFEQLLSRTIPTSDVGRINLAGGEPVLVEPETAELIDWSLRYSEESDGLFDITIGAVSELWDFHEGVVPSEEQVAHALPHVGWRKVHVGPDCHVTLDDPESRLDLGGIAKGYVTDVLCDEFRDAGVASAFVNLGGNVAVVGPKADGSPWSVGVRDPISEAGERSLAIVRTTSGSVVTSGLYERQFQQAGRRYWHILDPRTGYPVESDIVSATIFSERSLDGDGYTKPLFMLGIDRAIAFLEARGLDGLLVDESGKAYLTNGAPFELLESAG